jgi:hypothetical protein
VSFRYPFSSERIDGGIGGWCSVIPAVGVITSRRSAEGDDTSWGSDIAVWFVVVVVVVGCRCCGRRGCRGCRGHVVVVVVVVSFAVSIVHDPDAFGTKAGRYRTLPQVDSLGF